MQMSELNYTREPTTNEIFALQGKLKMRIVLYAFVILIKTIIPLAIIMTLASFVPKPIIIILYIILAIYAIRSVYIQLLWLNFLRIARKGTFKTAECFITNVTKEGSQYYAKVKLNDKQVIKDKFEVGSLFYKDWQKNPKMLCFLAGTEHYKAVLVRNDGRYSD